METMTKSVIVQIIFVAVFSLTLMSCAKTRQVLELETSVTLKISTSAAINPDSDGRPSPLFLRVLQLSDKSQFMGNSDFQNLLTNPQQALNGTLLATERFAVSPGQVIEKNVVLPISTVTYVGIIAEFSDYTNASTKLLLPVMRNQDNVFQIYINELNMSIQ